MTRVLLVADAPWVRNEVYAALTEPDTTIVELDDPSSAARRVMEDGIDIVLVDMQVGSMGAMAVTRSIREEMVLADRMPVPVVILLDRAADGFLAGRAGAAAWVAKPFTSQDLLEAFWNAIQRETPNMAVAAEPDSPDAADGPVEEPEAAAPVAESS